MSFIIKQKIGKYTYVYEGTSYWDKEKKQSRQKRKIIGKVDMKTNEIVLKEEKIMKEREVKSSVDSGNIKFLEECDKKIGNSENKIYDFFKGWASKSNHDKGMFYDITSISSYSKGIESAEWGYNRDKEALPYTTSLSKKLLLKSKDSLSNKDNLFLTGKNLYYCNKITDKLGENSYNFFVIRNKKLYDEYETALFIRIMEIEEYFRNNIYKSVEIMKEDLSVIAKNEAKYFDVVNNKSIISLVRNNAFIQQSLLKSATTILFSNVDSLTQKDIVDEYHSKDSIEKMFNSLKNENDLHRLKVHSSETMKGKIFIAFISLIIDTFILNTKNSSKLIKDLSRKEIIKELRKVKKIKFSDNFFQLTDISKKAKDIFSAFNFSFPAS